MLPPKHQDNKLIEITAMAFEKPSTTCGEQPKLEIKLKIKWLIYKTF